jgi:hypothetical protein
VVSSLQRPLRDIIQHKNKASTPPAGFEPTISANQRPQTYALDRTATGIGDKGNIAMWNANNEQRGGYTMCEGARFQGGLLMYC